ncbi:putative disease resistance protein [Rosa sericea]
MALGTKEEHIKKILELLKDPNVPTVVLDGKRGVGKTWIAKEIIKYKDLIHDTLWLYVNNNYDTESLHENIARQLSLLSIYEEWEDDDDAVEEEQSLEKLKPRISVKLEEFRSAAHKENKLFLLVLDDVPHQKDVEEIVKEVNNLLTPNDHKSFKVLITRGTTLGMNKEIESCNTKVHQIDPLSTDESLALLRERIKNEVFDCPSFEKLSKAIVEMSKGIPTVLITIAKAMNYLADKGSGVWSLENVLEEAACDGETAINLLLRSWCNALPTGAPTDCFWHTMQLLNKHGGVHYNELITQWIMEGYFGCNNQIGKVYEQGHKVLMDLIDWGMLRKQEDNMVVMGGIILSITGHCRREFNATARLGLANVFEDEKWKSLGMLAHTDRMIKSPSSHKTWEKVSTLVMDGHCIDREVPVTCFQRMEALQVLMLIKPRFKSLPVSLVDIKNLSILVLRFCDRLEKIDPIQEFQSLSVLEISGATLLEMIPDDFFEKMSNLRSLNLSEANVKSLPSSLFNKSELRWLILRGCSQLKTLPSLKSLGKLKVLDLSGATSFSRFRDKTFAPLQKLHTINLSNSQITRLPFLHHNDELNQLLLGGCASLNRLPTLNTIPRLQILDLSGATGLKEIQFEPLDSLRALDLSGTHIKRQPSSFSYLSDLSLRECRELAKLPLTKEIKYLESLDLSGSSTMVEIEDKFFQHTRLLRVLNFSTVKIKELPSLSNLANLCQLLLMDCSCLEKLPEMEGLKRLQVLNLSGCVALVDLPNLNSLEKLEILDISGCRVLKQIQEESFQKMFHIRILNLSDTMIEFLPSICKPNNLCHLILRNCKNLKKLPALEHLSKLEELNLCGASSLVDFKSEFLEHMVHLQILDLSEIPLTTVPSMSKFIKLRQFSVKGCSSLNEVLHLEVLTLLETLDLSGTAVPSLPPLNTFSNLYQLLLKDCSQIKELQFLESLSRLEVLDLSGTRMKQFPYEISRLTHLKQLYLPDLRGMSDIDLGKIKRLPQEVNWDECGIFECADIYIGSDKPSLSVSGFEIFHILDKHPKFREEKFKKFHFHVKKKEGEDGGINYCNDEFIFRDVYFHTRHFYPKEHDRSLEIYGSYSLPKGFESVLKCAECISLVDNDLIHSLSDLGSDNVRTMKGCWLERCSKVHNILSNEEAGVTLGRNLETLWISNLPILSSLYNGSVQSVVFQNLKQLYLDCCPGIINVFPSSQLPENLETLHVQFCDKLQTLFECDSQSSCAMQRLRKLYLLELPELKSIGIKLPAELTFVVIECPKLLKLQLDVTDKISK